MDAAVIEHILKSRNPGIRLARRAVKFPVTFLIRGLLSAGFNKVVTPDGYKFNVPSYLSVDGFLALRTGFYEPHEIKLLRQSFQPSDKIVEIGSNIGVVAGIAFNEKLNESGKMLCVEPNSAALSFLEENMTRQLNNNKAKRKKCSIIKSAIGSPAEEGVQDFLSKPSLSSGLRGLVRREERDQVIQVPVSSLSTILAKHADIAERRFSLICDAEGAEIPLIFEDAASLERCDQILIELHEPNFTGRTETPEMMLDELRNLGFRREATSGNCHVLAR